MPKEDIVKIKEINTSIKEIKPDSKILKSELKELICEIIWIKNKSNDFAIDFDGHGITLKISDGFILDKDDKVIKIYYDSEIGKSDFKIYPYFIQ